MLDLFRLNGVGLSALRSLRLPAQESEIAASSHGKALAEELGRRGTELELD